MDKSLALYKLLGPVEYNPACFDFSEEEAREKMLWRDPRPMPTEKQLKDAWKIVEKDLYAEKRKNDYEKEGLTFNKFLELLIEDDQLAIAEFKEKRNMIKIKFPKPEEK